MSVFAAEITKQILFTPPAIIRSSKYSETARGRSLMPSSRVPTGSNSFENASGRIRVPCPAAGTIPQRELMLLPRAIGLVPDCDAVQCARSERVHGRHGRCAAILPDCG